MCVYFSVTKSDIPFTSCFSYPTFLRKKSPFLLLISIIPLYDFPRLWCLSRKQYAVHFSKRAIAHGHELFFCVTTRCVTVPQFILSCVSHSLVLSSISLFCGHWIRYPPSDIFNVNFSFSTGFTDNSPCPIVLVVCVTFRRIGDGAAYDIYCRKCYWELLSGDSGGRGLLFLLNSFSESLEKNRVVLLLCLIYSLLLHLILIFISTEFIWQSVNYSWK